MNHPRNQRVPDGESMSETESTSDRSAVGRKAVQTVTVAVFVILLFGLALAFFLLPDKAFSEQENRSLRLLPKWTVQKMISGKYADEMNDYYADQFPWRDGFVGIKGMAEIAVGKGENDGVLLGKNGQLAKRQFDAMRADGSIMSDTDFFDPAHIAAGMEGLNRAGRNLSERSIPMTVLLAGRTLDVTASAFSYPSLQSDALRNLTADSLDSDALSYLDTVPLLRDRYERGEQVYFKTDHHWTTLGAYYAYGEILRSFGMEDRILPPEAFEARTLSDRFYGTTWSAGGMKFVSPDRLDVWLAGDEDEYLVICDGAESSGGFYNLSYLEKKDQFSLFLDGTHNVVTIKKKSGEVRPVLLLLKDSFANNLAPFLARHFDLVLLNLSAEGTNFANVTARAEEYGADRVLVVYNLENAVCDNRLSKLK